MQTKILYKVLSGEGTGPGTIRHTYATTIGIRRILTRERSGGDRWACAYYRLTPWDSLWINAETGEARSFAG